MHSRIPSKVRIPTATPKVGGSLTRIVLSPARCPKRGAEGGARWAGLSPIT